METGLYLHTYFYGVRKTAAALGIRCKMADASMEGIDLYADVDDFVRVST